MFIRHLSTIIITCALVAAALPIGPVAAAPRALSVWVESISNKVQPTTVPGSTSSIYLEGARRSVEAAQIIVRANGSALTSVNLTVGDLSDGHGHTLTRSSVTFFREYFSSTSRASSRGNRAIGRCPPIRRRTIPTSPIH